MKISLSSQYETLKEMKENVTDKLNSVDQMVRLKVEDMFFATEEVRPPSSQRTLRGAQMRASGRTS